MTRPLGSINIRHRERREELLRRVSDRLLEARGAKISFKEMATSADVSIPTLRHYFGSRDVLVQTVFTAIHDVGRPYLARAANAVFSFPASMEEAASSLLEGVRRGGTHRIHALGLTEGFDHKTLGPAYLDSILEPSLQALETRFAAHQQRGEMIQTSPRHAAIAFISPLLIAALHQYKLEGLKVRPMSLTDLAKDHVQAFIRAYAAPPS